MKKRLKQTWRWYGPDDPVSLSNIKQAGASGIVTALHHIPHGEVWPLKEIRERKEQIEAAGLSWDVVESVNVHEEIKTRRGDYKKYIEHYKKTLKNLGEYGLKTVCYNFMPVLDWTRTQLDYKLKDGSRALRFDWTDLAVFDAFVLKRKNAPEDYAQFVLKEAADRFKKYSKETIEGLTQNILMGVPSEAPTTINRLRQSIKIYNEIGKEGLRENLVYFLKNIMELCEEANIKMTIHPDDPPFPILGLPRTLSSLEDLNWLFKTINEGSNGLCFCTGSLGAGKQNDLIEIVNAVKNRIHFVHLRNVIKEKDNSFFESDHLDGDNDMYALMKILLAEQKTRNTALPYRPDHGHQMLDDLGKKTNPGYSAIGRLRGLAELRGLEHGILGPV